MKTPVRTLLFAAGATLFATQVGAAPITIGSEHFNDVNTASSTTVDFGGTGIPTDPVAWSDFEDTDGNRLILGLGTHGRFANPDVRVREDNVYGTVAGLNDGNPNGPGSSIFLGTTWNFSWFAEVIPTAGSTAALSDFGVELLYDLDASSGTDEANHGVIDLSGAIAASSSPNATVTQSSQNLAFDFLASGAPFVTPPGGSFDPQATGEYTFALQSNLGQVGIQMNVPSPAPFLLLLTGLAGLGLSTSRKRG